ncbi:hypothetical protein Aduo_016077 [Ancylostoma duodenale]
MRGFDVASESQDNRKVLHQDSVNKKVLLEWKRITGSENPRKKNYDKLLKDFVYEMIRYPNDLPTPLSWPTGAGTSGNIQAIRCKMTYDFWRFFLAEGRKNLAEYNKDHWTEIRISREKSLPMSDMDRLGLYIRKKIKERYLMANKKPVDVTIRRGLLQIGDRQPMKPTTAAYKFGIGMSTWNGLPLRELLTAEEKKAVDSGELKFGSEKLAVDLSDIQLVPNNNSTTNTEQHTNGPNNENGDASTSGTDVGQSNRKRMNPLDDKENPAKMLKLN